MLVCNMLCGYCGGWLLGEYDVYWYMVVRGEFFDRDFIYELGESYFVFDCFKVKNNRCKCMFFLVYYMVKRCMVKCCLGCGYFDLGRYKGNVMMCIYWCCMCGIRNLYVGKDCRLKWCRWGGVYLGQDYGWNLICWKEGCDRFLCGVYCQGCFGMERLFDEKMRRCWRFRGLEERLEERLEVWGRRGWEWKGGGGQEIFCGWFR